MNINTGIGIDIDFENNEFIYTDKTFGVKTEKRKLDDIRKSLLDCNCEGEEIVYSIAMDIGRKEDEKDLKDRNLLYGACIYNKGLLGKEPIRSQGHIHAVSKSCGYSTPEVYEIWYGNAIIFMQQYVADNIGKVFAIEAKKGDIVIVPPNWGHYTVNVNPKEKMAFGAWCVRDFGFEYDEIRKRCGLSYYPIFENGNIEFIKNKNYVDSELIVKNAREYSEFNIEKNVPIYEQYLQDKDMFNFVTEPEKYKTIWETFIP